MQVANLIANCQITERPVEYEEIMFPLFALNRFDRSNRIKMRTIKLLFCEVEEQEILLFQWNRSMIFANQPHAFMPKDSLLIFSFIGISSQRPRDPRGDFGGRKELMHSHFCFSQTIEHLNLKLWRSTSYKNYSIQKMFQDFWCNINFSNDIIYNKRHHFRYSCCTTKKQSKQFLDIVVLVWCCPAASSLNLLLFRRNEKCFFARTSMQNWTVEINGCTYMGAQLQASLSYTIIK